MSSRGVNKVIIIGNLGQDPITKYLPSGGAVTNVTIATSESWKDKASGQMQERTEWNKVVFFNRLAEIAGEFLKKGSKVYIEGSLRTRSYDKDGQKHYITEIVANEMQMLDGRGNQHADDSQGFDQPHQGHVSGYTERPAPAAKPQPRAAAPARAPAPAEDFDDDIPF